jgi:hypothetical protein
MIGLKQLSLKTAQWIMSKNAIAVVAVVLVITHPTNYPLKCFHPYNYLNLGSSTLFYARNPYLLHKLLGIFHYC